MAAAVAAALAIWLGLARSNGPRAESRDEAAPAVRERDAQSGPAVAGARAATTTAPARVEIEASAAEEGSRALAGRIVDPNHNPIAGARVRVASAIQSQVFDARRTTAGDGSFRVSVPRRVESVLLDIGARGFARRWIRSLPIGLIDLDVGAIRLAAPSRLLGRVVGANGEAIANATIHSWPCPPTDRRPTWGAAPPSPQMGLPGEDGPEVLTTTTAADGTFRFDTLSTDPNYLCVEADPFPGSRKVVRVGLPEGSEDSIEIQLSKPGTAIGGAGRPSAWETSEQPVVRKLGELLRRQQLKSLPEANEPDPRMRIHLVVESGEERSGDSKLNCEYVRLDGTRGPINERQIEVATHAIEGRAWGVDLHYPKGPRFLGLGLAADSEAEIVMVARFPNGLVCETPKFQLTPIQPDPIALVARPIPNQSPIRGILADWKGSSLPGFRIHGSGRDERVHNSWPIEQVTDTAGRFTFFGSPGQSLVIQGRDPNHVLPATTIEIDSQAPPPLVLVAGRGARVSGSVLVNGANPNHPLVLGVWRTWFDSFDPFDGGCPNPLETLATDSAGRFRTIALPAGPLCVGLIGDLRDGVPTWRGFDNSLTNYQELVVEDGGEGTILLDIPMPMLASVRGRVTCDGRPVANCGIELRRVDATGDAPSQETTDTGSFRFETTEPGAYELSARHLGVSLGKRVEVGRGARVVVELDFATGTVVGTLLDVDGTPASGTLRLVRDGDPKATYRDTQEAVSGEDGNYRFERITAGRWRLFAMSFREGSAITAFGPFEIKRRRSPRFQRSNCARLCRSRSASPTPRGFPGAGASSSRAPTSPTPSVTSISSAASTRGRVFRFPCRLAPPIAWSSAAPRRAPRSPET